jgi:hypothetical protein
MKNEPTDPVARATGRETIPAWEDDDEAAEIRYSLTALGESVLGDERAGRRKKRFRGFGPCRAVA